MSAALVEVSTTLILFSLICDVALEGHAKGLCSAQRGGAVRSLKLSDKNVMLVASEKNVPRTVCEENATGGVGAQVRGPAFPRLTI